jgi:hypothetical protein
VDPSDLLGRLGDVLAKTWTDVRFEVSFWGPPVLSRQCHWA